MRLITIFLLLSVAANRAAYAEACYSDELDAEFTEAINYVGNGNSVELLQVVYPKHFKNRELSWSGFQEFKNDRAAFSVELTKIEHGNNYLSSIFLRNDNSVNYFIAARYGSELDGSGCVYVVKAKIEHNKRLQIDAAPPRD